MIKKAGSFLPHIEEYDLTTGSIMTDNKASKDCNFYDTISKLRGHIEDEMNQSEMIEETTSLQKYNHDLLSYYETLLQQSPTALALYQNFLNKNWTIQLCDLEEIDFTIDYAEQLLELNNQGLSQNAIENATYFRNSILFAFIRALRDINQENNIHVITADYKAEHMLMIERFRCADMDTTAILIAWELRQQGYNDLWRYLLGSDYRDMAIAFSQDGEKDENKAILTAFNQWFVNQERVSECEREALDYMDNLLKERENSYHQLGNKELSPEQIEFLSSLPNKAPYLQHKGQNILQDDHYAGLSDEINKAHLFHIIYDMKAVFRGGVAFSDKNLAQKIFPEESETLH